MTLDKLGRLPGKSGRRTVTVSGGVFILVAVLLVCEVHGQSDTGAPPAAQPSQVTAPGGQWDFQTDLFTGRFTTRVPIVVPPARGNATPNIVLGYSSGGGNGWCGVGWALDMGFIQRDARDGVPVKRDGNGDPLPDYTDDCGFVASFQGTETRLIPLGGAMYCAEVERAFTKFGYSNGVWTAVDKAGTRYFFGSTTYSQMNTRFGTFRWALDKVVDINGNATYLSYTKDGGQLYLSQMRYNAHESDGVTDFEPTHFVDFNLGARPDTNINCRVGECISTRKLLTNIVVRVSDTVARSYSLIYSNSPSTGRSLLAEVKQFATNGTSSLPPLKFAYQNMALQFSSTVPTYWGPLDSQGDTGPEWNSIRYGRSNVHLDLLDINGDGLPDRVMRKKNEPYTHYRVQLNTGKGFQPALTNWGPLAPPGRRSTASVVETNVAGDKFYTCSISWQNPTGATNAWGRVSQSDEDPAYTYLALMDINGDGFLDRVMRQAKTQNCTTNASPFGGLPLVPATYPYTNLVVQLGNGRGFDPPVTWGPTTNFLGDSSEDWNGISKGSKSLVLQTIDINGDGLPDRAMWKGTEGSAKYKLQLNTGRGFSPELINWGPLNNQNAYLGHYDRTQRTTVWGVDVISTATGLRLQDINGDGLPDRLMVKTDAPRKLVVQLNNGVGFEPEVHWGPLFPDVFGYDEGEYRHVISRSQDDRTLVDLIDINGDGLPDHVMSFNTLATQNKYKVQLNTGSGFRSPVFWQNLSSQGGTVKVWNQVRDNHTAAQYDLIDINGDGLPDRVMRKINQPHDSFRVQLSPGPFPDLMNRVDNGIGGSALISYKPSTVYTNTGSDGIPDLPYPVYTVASVAVTDGRGNTNKTSYSYRDGYHDWNTPEFRGFNRVEATDPLGTKSITYFHQGRQSTELGARTPDGYFTDEPAKKGVPYRSEVWGSDGKKYSQTLSVVGVTNTHSGASVNCWFPFVLRTVNYEFEGLTGVTPKMTATEFQYDPETGDMLKQSSLGEVIADLNTGGVTNVLAGDELYTLTTYTNFPGYDNVTRPTRVWTSSDSAGQNKLRETLFEYDSKTRLAKSLRWIDWDNTYATNSINLYDDFGNPLSATDAAGITTTTDYDSIYHLFPEKTITATFTNTATYDVRSGQTLTATDAKGLKTETLYDEFFRPVETRIYTNAPSYTSYIRRNTFEYLLSGITSTGISQNRVRKFTNDGPTEGGGGDLESTTYFDGLGRTIQTRVKSEIACGATIYQHRVADAEYDARGNVRFQSLPYFSCSFPYSQPPTNSAGTTNEYDAIGRAIKVIPPAGDTDSPTGPESIAYRDGTEVWATVSTDAQGKVRKSFHDAYGRARQILEHGGYTTYFNYDLLGNLTNVTDHAGNVTRMSYDSLGRKRQMTDPDMGTWSYSYDAAGRMVRQIDAKGQKLTFFYDDPLGRLTQKSIFNAAGFWQADVTYAYDVSDDPNFTVFPGQLYKVTDRQGHQKNSYDIQGRVLKSRRHLDVNDQDYDVQNKYDVLDRVTEVTYPGNATKIKYSYDIGGNLNRVESTCGTGSNEIFYRAGAFNELGQLTSYTNGNGVVTSYSYYDNSKRLRQIQSLKGSTNLQQLAYSYDKVSNIKSINDLAYRGQSGDATLTAIQYDDLHRLKSYTRGATPFNFQYNAIGNITVNPEFGAGTYQYASAKPHAVTSANGKTYAYDANGNMTNRNGQVLIYDEENQLVEVRNTDGKIIRFGYSDGGARLWQQVTEGGTTRTTIWIGGIYELKDGKTLCHVFADGRRVATFQPQGALCAFIQRTPLLAASQKWLKLATTWPFSEGRTPLTVCLFPLFGILAASVFGRRRKIVIPSLSRNLSCFGFGLAHRRRISRLPLRTYPRWMQLINVILTVALFVAVTPTQVEAQTYDPVFYYYHGDHLGSSNVLTGRDGHLVQHYEYTAFGKERFKDNTLAFSVSHRYTGQIFDEATGLYYYNARYYDPELGRFTQADSAIPNARDPQAFNRYSYVVNNPLKYVDPSGNLPFLAIVAIVAVAGAGIGAAVSAIQGRNVLQGALAGMFSGGLGAFLPDRYQQIVIAAGAAALFAIATTFAVGALWGAVSTTATVGQGLAWAASQAAVVGLSAAATTAVLNIPPVARALAKAGFWAEILASMALTFGFQLAFANLLYGPTNILNTDEYIQQQIAREGLTGDAAAQRAAQIRLELNQAAARLRVEGRGGTMFGSMPGDAAKIAGKDVGLVVGVEKVVVSRGQVVGYISEGMILGSPEHVGVAFVNVPSRIELRGWSGHLGGGYLLWGISHQTFSSTFLQAGYAGSVLTAGSGYSRYLSSFVYGPYGGGAFQALYNARGEL